MFNLGITQPRSAKDRRVIGLLVGHFNNGDGDGVGYALYGDFELVEQIDRLDSRLIGHFKEIWRGALV